MSASRCDDIPTLSGVARGSGSAALATGDMHKIPKKTVAKSAAHFVIAGSSLCGVAWAIIVRFARQGAPVEARLCADFRRHGPTLPFDNETDKREDNHDGPSGF